MSLLKTKEYDFNRETGEATYTYTYKGQEFTGVAKCHEDDNDFQSMTLGVDLAETRAYRLFLMARRDELAIRKDTLISAMNNMIGADNLFSVSCHKNVLEAMIKDTISELEECRYEINRIRLYLDKKIKDRDRMYKKIRAKRKEENKMEA